MLDYKDIITRHYALQMSGKAIAEALGISPSGVNDFLRAFKDCKTLGYGLAIEILLSMVYDICDRYVTKAVI